MFNKDNVEKLMQAKGWTKYRLAKESGLGQSTVHEILSGKKKTPNASTLQKMAMALDVTVDVFFDDDSNSNTIERNNTEEKFDSDIIRIERARRKMPKDEQENMMKVLEAAFAKYFND